ncbi:nuclear transport factor 2 family protein [Sphingobacterium sp. MYb382]|uniref:nuclear transport factor 2 family protein n=1 Tax=Sphingobacterium sp. MYb382 TaxID=2745278 RepID=UPI0030A039E8
MKKALFTLTALFFVLTSMSSFAANRSNPSSANNSKAVVNTYMAASVLGDSQWNKNMLTEDFTLINTANGTEHDKKSYSKFLKENKGLKYNCATSYEMLNETEDSALAKATLQFENFTRVDYITLQPSKNGWKIAKIVTTYQ